MSEADKIADLTRRIESMKNVLIYAHGYIYSNCNLIDAQWILSMIYNAAYPKAEKPVPLDLDAE